MNQHSQGFSPQYDNYRRTRRRFPSQMQGATIDRAAERLSVSGHALSDVPAWRLLRLLGLDIERKEREAVRIELQRRRLHGTSEEDLRDPLFQAWLSGKVVTL
ncbi:hypothetical protein [Armatimonas sp.]|uniref:hypothetical protein n=1 Tax=Armatimonas sp. TaxID=1872638 RepID=UPI00286C5D08|nr:hypothetical protein [Armatimonas sp.]